MSAEDLVVSAEDVFQRGLIHDWVSWVEFLRRLNDFNQSMYHGLRYLAPIGSRRVRRRRRAVQRSKDRQAAYQLESFEGAVSACLDEIAGDFEFTNALILLATFGAFEAFLDDVIATQLEHEPHWNDGYENGKKKAKKKITGGAGKFEPYLALVGLEGHDDISDGLGSELEAAHRIRNVWAHNAGKADEQFLRWYPSSTVAIGDVVRISSDDCQRYVSALAAYAWLIMCRYRLRRKLGPMVWQPRNAHAQFALEYIDEWHRVLDEKRPLNDTVRPRDK